MDQVETAFVSHPGYVLALAAVVVVLFLYIKKNRRRQAIKRRSGRYCLTCSIPLRGDALDDAILDIKRDSLAAVGKPTRID
jgi:hypothetical protein